MGKPGVNAREFRFVALQAVAAAAGINLQPSLLLPDKCSNANAVGGNACANTKAGLGTVDDLRVGLHGRARALDVGCGPGR